MAEHYRPKIGYIRAGYYQGYYCSRCGAPGVSLQGRRDHGLGGGICLANPIMVAKLNEANTIEAETKRQFVRGLKKGKPANPPMADWEYTVGGRKKK